MNPWKPIETAPKDGTPILVGCWQPRRSWNKDTKKFDRLPDVWVAATVFWCRLYEGEWVLVEAGDYSDLPTLGRKVTHWTEIPAPPPQK